MKELNSDDVRVEIATDTYNRYQTAYEQVDNKMREKVGDIIRSFVSDMVLTSRVEVRVYEDCEYIEVSVCADKSSISLGMYFRYEWSYKGDGKQRLSINPSTGGSFSKDDSKWCDYFALVGKIAMAMGDIENRLLALDWDAHDLISRKACIAKDELDTIIDQIEQKKRDAAEKDMNSFLAGLNNGDMITINGYSETFQKVTKKRVNFAGLALSKGDFLNLWIDGKVSNAEK